MVMEERVLFVRCGINEWQSSIFSPYLQIGLQVTILDILLPEEKLDLFGRFVIDGSVRLRPFGRILALVLFQQLKLHRLVLRIVDASHLRQRLGLTSLGWRSRVCNRVRRLSTENLVID